MRPSRALIATILLASLALAGCGARGAARTSALPAATAAPTATPTTNSPSPTAPPTPKAAPCAETRGWGTGAKQRAASSTAALYLVRVGQHDCYDRVVLVVNDPGAAGYSVRYADVVSEDGSGIARPVAGAAALEVVVHAPALGLDDHGYVGKSLAKPGQDFYSAAQLAGWRSLRQVRYAGSFEGQTTIAVGVRARAPFRVFTLLDTQSQIMRVVLDIAH
jgi:hypothetical protein